MRTKKIKHIRKKIKHVRKRNKNKHCAVFWKIISDGGSMIIFQLFPY